jgi:hypothetical protein
MPVIRSALLTMSRNSCSSSPQSSIPAWRVCLRWTGRSSSREIPSTVWMWSFAARSSAPAIAVAFSEDPTDVRSTTSPSSVVETSCNARDQALNVTPVITILAFGFPVTRIRRSMSSPRAAHFRRRDRSWGKIHKPIAGDVPRGITDILKRHLKPAPDGPLGTGTTLHSTSIRCSWHQAHRCGDIKLHIG